MIDFISLIWTVLRDCDVTIWSIIIVVALFACLYLLVKEYGRTFIRHLFHRRNLLSLCGILLYFCAFLALFKTGLFTRFSLFLRVLLILLYVGYIIAVLRSVQAPILLSGLYLKRYQKWLKRDQAHEHCELLKKMPWYFLDANERIGYQVLKGKYLYERGNLHSAYTALSTVDRKLLYTEELSNLTVDLVFILQMLGNLTKADALVEAIKPTDKPAYGFLKSYLSELHGDLESAWRYAQDGENAVDIHNHNASILSSLYTQLGRLSCFRGNITETFRYYRLALEQAKKYGDVRLLHPAYQNLLNQIRIQHQHEKEWEPLMREYTASIVDSSLKSLLEMENFCLADARQRGDREVEFSEIMNGYRHLHQRTAPPEQYMIEISTLKMLNNGGYDISVVLADVAQHFNSYFTLPLPARFIVLQDMTRPAHPTAEQMMLYESWTPKMVEYARSRAMADLDQYERTLPSDYVNERCWVILQRVNFTRRSSPQYDGQQVLRWMWEAVQIYQDSGQLFKEVETEIHIVKQYDEMIGLGQLSPDGTTLNQVRDIVADAVDKSTRLPTLTIGALLIDLAHFSAKLGQREQAIDALNRFHSLHQSPLHFSSELQQKITLLEQSFPMQAEPQICVSP